MGNLSSSCISIQKSSNSKTMAKLVDPQGQLTLVDLPTTVAELMLENPGFALTPVEEVRKTHRLSAMRADDQLLGRKLYLLVPVDKVNSRLTDLQMAAIDSFFCCSNKNKVGGKTRGKSKVSPSLDDRKLEDLVKDLTGKNTGVIGQRKSFCKAWEPVLEPILEGC